MPFRFRWVLLAWALVPLPVAGFAAEVDLPVHRGIVYSTVDKAELKMDLVQPAGDGPFPLILWFHGGAYQVGDRRDCPEAVLGLAKHGYAVASIDYRLAPAHKWPAQLEDARAALAFCRGNAREYKIDPDRAGVAGASAGGHLARMLGFARQDGKPAAVKAIVNIFGPTDWRTWAPTKGGEAALVRFLHKDSNGILLDLLGTSDRKAKIVAESSPVSHVTSSVPPVLTLQGSADTLCPLAQAKALHEALQKAGATEKLLVVEGAGHLIPWPPGKRDMVNRTMIDFLDNHLKRPAK